MLPEGARRSTSYIAAAASTRRPAAAEGTGRQARAGRAGGTGRSGRRCSGTVTGCPRTVTGWPKAASHGTYSVSYTHLRAHETRHDLVCRLLLEKKKQQRL